MKQAKYEVIPLNDDEKGLLILIFHKRRRFLFTVYAILIVIAFAVSPLSINRRALDASQMHGQDEKKSSQTVSWFGKWMISLAFVESFVIVSGIIFFIKRVLPFRLDANSCVKEKIPYAIVSKEYFPLTNQYYVALSDPKYLHHEVDEETYYNCFEGGTIYIYRTIKSKFVFEDNGRYSIL